MANIITDNNNQHTGEGGESNDDDDWGVSETNEEFYDWGVSEKSSYRM